MSGTPLNAWSGVGWWRRWIQSGYSFECSANVVPESRRTPSAPHGLCADVAFGYFGSYVLRNRSNAFSASAFVSACHTACRACRLKAVQHASCASKSLLAGLTVHFLQRSPETHGAVSNRELRHIHPARLQLQQYLAPALCRTPSSIDRNRFSPRSFTPITTNAHSFVCSARSPLYTPSAHT